MATINGSTNSSIWGFKLEVTEAETSVANNTSSVQVDVYMGCLNSSSYMYGAKIPVTVKCTGVANKSFTYSNSGQVNYSAGQWRKIGSVTFTGVPHNSDGSKTVTISASFTNNVSPGSGSASGTFTLTKLARKSSLSVGTNLTLGTQTTLTINCADSGFTHRLTCQAKNEKGSTSGVVTIAAETTATSISWTPPLSFATINVSGTSVSLNFVLATYSGDDWIGSVAVVVKGTIPPTVKPSCELILDDVTGIDDIYGSPVQNLSKIKITVTPSTAQGSPIASYSITAEGRNYASTPVTTDVLKIAGDSTITATVKDQRGRSGSASYTMKVQAYEFPRVSKLTVHRCDADGTANDEGEYVKVVFSASITSLDSKNTATYTLRRKKTTETSWTALSLTGLANVYTVSDKTYILPADSSSTYDIEVEAKDRHGTYVKSTSVSTAFTLMNWGDDGTSLAIGKVAEKANTLDIALNTEVHAPIKLAGEDKVLLSLSADFESYGDNSANQPWCRRNAAGLVEVHGVVSPTNASNALNSNTETIICHLPAGCRPAVGFYQICQGSGADLWLAAVAPDGTVSASRHRSGGNFTQPSTSAGLMFHLIFMADQ